MIEQAGIFGMELRTLRYFCAVARERHFTRAAQLCNVSQSALSHQIKKLEEELGCRLVERSSKRVELTVEGAIFFEHCRPAIDRIFEGVERLRQLSPEPRSLRIGVWGHFLLTEILPSSLLRLREGGFSQPIQVIEVSGIDLFAALDDSRIDFAIAGEVTPRRGFTLTPLYMEELALAVPLDDPLAPLETLPLTALNGRSLGALTKNYASRLALERALAEVDVHPCFVAELNSPETLRDFANRAQLPIVAPIQGFRDLPEVKTVRLVSPTPSRPMMLITREGTEFTAPALELIKTMREIWDAFGPSANETAA
ncbi:LysR family transcriptional regulator [Novosphingobium flavum]|uniref:LysR family transcriptional regulator n=1 Tax=Novosphingobium flavum TaxID=1778672 RepID=A0A7X1FSU4_9SPHN|nr:LysR family transcriptional regulator [Novosphingobium flavum]MBC2665707.1 LysR family transcriptional regulator [Novosphingobium flavum]